MAINLANRPIFVIGSERSGTTLLMAMVGCHPRIAVPEVAWYYPRFRPYLHTYGDLARPANFRVLMEEMAFGLKTPFWDMKINPRTLVDELTATARESSFAGAYCAMLDRHAAEHGKPRWGEKTPYNQFFIKEILEDFPNAQFLYLTRDGRDASADYLESSFGPTNIYCAAEIWRMGQEAVRPWREKLPATQWLDVKYEDLVRDTVRVLRNVCRFLGEEYSPELLEFHRTTIAQRRGATQRKSLPRVRPAARSCPSPVAPCPARPARRDQECIRLPAARRASASGASASRTSRSASPAAPARSWPSTS
jgi:hypothetical protein